MHPRCLDGRRFVAHRIEVQPQLIDLQLQALRQAQHQVHAAHRAGHGQPLRAFMRGPAVEDRQAKLDVAHAQATRIRVDLVGFKAAVAVGIAAVRPQAHKAGQARTAQAEHLGLGLAAVSQGHFLDAAL